MSTNATVENLVPIFIMGKRYEVPETFTIMKAMEHTGYKFLRGCGCRGGVCGACSAVYRKAGDYHIRSGLACQTVVEPDMYLAQLPFYPALRQVYDYATTEAAAAAVFALYPELFRCVACNACTKICPMEVQVMDYVAALKRGDILQAAEQSFDCIQCGLCASRCMGELPQYHIAQVARRLAGGKLKPRAQHLADMLAAIQTGRFGDALADLRRADKDRLRTLYEQRELEPEMTGEEWRPQATVGL
ncbi:MAG: 4Fe-4S dicluster domain-containing protein [Deltaproteobacteria bacterium]|nr:4Fe-4S dicluster domain-containing protein [Deltaproteobacteria bacterium]